MQITYFHVKIPICQICMKSTSGNTSAVTPVALNIGILRSGRAQNGPKSSFGLESLGLPTSALVLFPLVYLRNMI